MNNKNVTTIDDIIKAKNELDKLGPKPMENPFAYKPMQYAGLPVYEVHDTVVPKLQVSETFADKWLTDEARDKINAKLVDLLGVNVIKTMPDGIFYNTSYGIIAKSRDIKAIMDVIA